MVASHTLDRMYDIFSDLTVTNPCIVNISQPQHPPIIPPWMWRGVRRNLGDRRKQSRRKIPKLLRIKVST